MLTMFLTIGADAMRGSGETSNLFIGIILSRAPFAK
jgi:hypothetical protein